MLGTSTLQVQPFSPIRLRDTGIDLATLKIAQH
jgi:hypothetical protein